MDGCGFCLYVPHDTWNKVLTPEIVESTNFIEQNHYYVYLIFFSIIESTSPADP